MGSSSVVIITYISIGFQMWALLGLGFRENKSLRSIFKEIGEMTYLMGYNVNQIIFIWYLYI